MVELGLVDYFVMGEAVGIVATFVAAFYYSRKQMQKLSTDIETKVLSDVDEKMNDLTRIAIEKPQLIKIVSNVESDISEEIAFTYHLLHTFAHVYHMHQRKVVSDNEWAGWLRRMRTCFEQGKIREYWEAGLELEKWFDPAFEDFIDKEVVEKTSPKQKRQVLLDNKTEVSAKIVVIAAGPMDAYSLFDDNDRPDVLSKIAKEAKPIRLVCLDVALSSLPDKDTLFALGVDHPLYFSVHSAYAKLAPKGGALIHVAKYLGTSIQPKPREDQPELEAFLDLLQPGWRQVLVKKRPLQNMVVSNALVTAADGGLGGRPNPRIAANLYIVGDWVGKEGLVSNAAVASAKNAAQQILNE